MTKNTKLDLGLAFRHPALGADEDPTSPDLSETTPEELERLAARLAKEEDVAGTILLLLDALKKEQRESKKFQEEAVTSPVTSLPNKRAYELILDHEVKRRGSVGNLCLIYADLSLFKLVNDTHGHDAGDQTLQKVADALSNVCREEDLVAHLGGDEFAVILPNCSLEQSDAVKKRIEKAFENFGFDYEGKRITVGINMGIALHKSGENANDLDKRAEEQMRLAKESDKARADHIRYHLPNVPKPDGPR